MELDELRKIHVAVAADYEGLVDIHIVAGPKGVPDDYKTMGSVWTDGELHMHKDFGAGRASLFLIRPDGYVGFRNQPRVSTTSRNIFREFSFDGPFPILVRLAGFRG